MSFPDDTGMVGFELPSLDEYCGDRGLDPNSESAQEAWRDYCEDCIDDMEADEDDPDEEDSNYIGPKGSIDRTFNLADEAYERSIDA